ncbi:MAG: M1 family metallopeptidase [Dehalococcoidia bacterium]
MTMPDLKSSPYRLPETVVPERYDLVLSPDLTAATFTGEETVTVQVRQPTAEIVLNAIELGIDRCSAVQGDSPPLRGSVQLDEANEQAILHFPNALSVGTWRLHLTFRGTLNDKLAGFYRSTYRSDSGEEQALASTQFEATDARRAFPCWDEPAFKAVFGVTLIVEDEQAAISNSPVVSESAQGDSGKKAVVFADTIPMSTYLVAFIVGAFEASEPVIAGSVPLRVWAVPGKADLTHYALEAGAYALRFFEEYYGIAYPAPKVDLIAIPDFAFGAMENLGAVTFRETVLLVDERTATHAELESVAVVIAHELAHMWFGDLVTMRWWNGIWLNEAFATFMEMLAVDRWKPEWETWVAFGPSRQTALLIDGLHSSRPVEFAVQRPEEAQAMFDVLTYQKGAAVLRMLEQYLGAGVFQSGITSYLQKHKYGNTETSDLWDALEAASGQPVRRMMDSWIFQPGYPLVTAALEEDGTGLRLSQQRFLYLQDGEAPPTSWQVPIIFGTASPSGAREERVLLSEAETTVPLQTEPGWLALNRGGHGFYRVRYSPDLLRRLIPQIQSGLSAVERFSLVSDMWAGTLAGYTTLADFLDLTTSFREETDESVWTILMRALGYLRGVANPENLPALAALVRDRLETIQRRLGWLPSTDENERTRQLRGLVLGAMGTFGNDPATRAEAYQRYAAYRRDQGTVDPNIVPALISILAYTGDVERYDRFWDAYKNAKTPQEKDRYLYALAGFQEEGLLRRTLAHTLDGEIRTQDSPYLIQSIFHNSKGSELAWQFTQQHWETILSRFPENAITRMCEGVTALLTPEREADVALFFQTHTVPQAGKQIEQHLERLRMGVLFRQREAANLQTYTRQFAGKV